MLDKYPDPMVNSNEVAGTDVYSPSHEKVGHIDHLVIDKKSGNVAYAVMQFGGFLGMGESEHPIPWRKLRYSEDVNGFVTDITSEQLEGAPERSENWRNDRDWQERQYRHFDLPPYWL